MHDFFYTAWEFMKHTPWWVYLILVYCLYIGLKATRSGTVSIYKMAVIPCIFLWLSLDTYATFVGDNSQILYISLIYWGALLIGALLGALQGKLQHITTDKKNRLIHVPGTWSVFIIILIIFVSKYWVGYQIGMHPSALNQLSFAGWALGITGVTSGLFVGKTIYYVTRLMTGPFVDL